MTTLVNLAKQYNKNEITLDDLFTLWSNLQDLTANKNNGYSLYEDQIVYTGNFENSFEALYYISDEDLSKEKFSEIYNKLLENSK